MNFQSKFLHNHAASVICWGRGDILNYIVRFIIRSDGPIGFFPFGHFSDHHSFDSEVGKIFSQTPCIRETERPILWASGCAYGHRRPQEFSTRHEPIKASLNGFADLEKMFWFVIHAHLHTSISTPPTPKSSVRRTHTHRRSDSAVIKDRLRVITANVISPAYHFNVYR